MDNRKARKLRKKREVETAPNRLEQAAQMVILVFGALSVALLAADQKVGFVVGLLMQPFWFYTAWQHKQWGVFAVSFLYTASYLWGIWRWLC